MRIKLEVPEVCISRASFRGKTLENKNSGRPTSFYVPGLCGDLEERENYKIKEYNKMVKLCGFLRRGCVLWPRL